ncbi:MAG: AcrR family transcriptional regulator [Bermanella sp.]|jgi:AcrR family transcriptional regulator
MSKAREVVLQTVSQDGRRQRSERSRKAIIAAAIALIDDGVVVPTAQQVTERAGLGTRSFFQHFEDMEVLYIAIDEEIRPLYMGFFIARDRGGTLDERIFHALECYADVYDKFKSVSLSTAAQRWRSEHLRGNYSHANQYLRTALDELIPELKLLSAAKRDAVDAMASFELWNRLREHQNLSKQASLKLVVGQLQRLLVGE